MGVAATRDSVIKVHRRSMSKIVLGECFLLVSLNERVAGWKRGAAQVVAVHVKTELCDRRPQKVRLSQSL